MTDRYHSVAVVLKKDVREDDAEFILNAIRMIKGVLSVKPYIADHVAHMAEERAKKELEDRILEVFHPKS